MAFNIPDGIINAVFLLWLLTMFFNFQIKTILFSKRFTYLFFFLAWLFVVVTIGQGISAGIIRVYKLLMVLSPILMYDLYKNISRRECFFVIICFSILFVYNSSIIITFANMTDGLGLRRIEDNYEVYNSIASSISIALIIPVISFFLFNPLPSSVKSNAFVKAFLKILLALIIVYSIYVLFRAAFMTQLFVGILGIIWGAFYRKRNWKTRIVIYTIVPFVIFLSSYSLVMQKIDSIEDTFILQEKMDEIYYTLSGQKSQAVDYEARSNRALLSFNTFLKNPITGVVIESKGFEDQYKLGVGNHSEWADCFALYGIPALLLLAFVFTSLKQIGKDLKFYLFVAPYFIIGCLNPILFFPQTATTFFFIPILLRYYYNNETRDSSRYIQ